MEMKKFFQRNQIGNQLIDFVRLRLIKIQSNNIGKICVLHKLHVLPSRRGYRPP
jgi:hypothetical protein